MSNDDKAVKESSPPQARGGAKALRRNKTAGEIQAVIAEFQQSEAKMSISAIAKASGVTPALIHNTYPDLAEKIRRLMGRSTRAQRDGKHAGLMREKETNRALRQELSQLKEDFARMASNNQMLIEELSILKGVASGKVVSILRSASGNRKGT